MCCVPDSFTEVADRVWVARRDPHDVNLTVVGGERGVVVVDTHDSAAAGRALLEDVRRLGVGEVLAVVVTHAHHDHVLGTASFREAHPDLPVHAHEDAVVELAAWSAASPGEAADLVLPDRTFSSAAVVDLGDRALELVHPGRAHTSGDLVVRVPDADVVLAGDLVEEAGPPAYGPDSFPLEWPLALDVVLQLVTPATVVVPGHGAPVDRDFVMEQRADIGVVAETVRDLAARGVPLAQAREVGEWPFEASLLEHAVARAYEQLPRSQKRLPLL